jgi:CRISPR-associated protein Cmr4
MSHAILGLLAETFIHPGSGQNEGVIDLPVAREAATYYPFIAGSSLKGALLDKDRSERDGDEAETKAIRKLVFGEPNQAGQLLVGDARILLLPTRSLSGVYRWATCPLVLERVQRDFQRAGMGDVPSALPKVETGAYLGAGTAGEKIFLEERELRCQGAVAGEWIAVLGKLIAHTETRNRLTHQLVVLDNEAFAWFARYGLPVQARNVLDSDTKESKNLWYEETLPPDTVLYAVLAQRRTSDDALGHVLKLVKHCPYLQSGGNETVGQGWFAVQPLQR